MEVTVKGGKRRIVVIHHREAKTDHQNEGHKVGEVEPAAMLSSGERSLDAIPNHQDGGEGPEEVLTHSIEDPKVLLHERVNCLQHFVEEVHGFSVVPGSGPSFALGQPVAAK